ncbi:MAG TPA: RluA family pseudouridine synthase [Lachnospiraceae bacterium]|nr:RluA family pseudouridine synthase [Lachnospiraceae bacterium]
MQTQILFEDQDIIVAYKPAGLAVQTAQLGRQDMESELKNHFRQPFLGVVHRLDQPVEGVLVFGKTPKSTAGLNRQLSEDDFCKEYLAVVCGLPSSKEQQLVDYLVKDGSSARICASADAEKEHAKKAVLHYEIVETIKIPKLDIDASLSLLKVTLQTGRFHQIRAQLSKLGNPLLGDSKYGTSESTLLSQKLNIRNVALCAHRLVFKHPVSNEKMEYCVSPKNVAFAFFQE